MNIRKILLTGTLALLCAVQASAIPAYPGKMKALQADGTEIVIQKLGDEHCHMTITDDGYPLVYNALTHNYEYASMQQGELKTSGIIAANPALRSNSARQFLSTIDKEQVMTEFNSQFSAALKEANAAYTKSTTTANGPKKIVRISDVPTIGKHDALVILVQFANWKFTDSGMMDDPVAYYDRFFHQKGFSDNGARGSVYDFYRDGSNNRYDPQFKVYGPVTVSGNYADYAGSGGSALTYKLIQEAVPLVDSLYDVDFRTFDTDSDGVVDNVYCIYAGYGQADSYYSNAIWPHSYNLDNDRADHSFKVDGVKIDRYTVSQEINGQSKKPVGIGTFVHEFGHVLGFADHYNNGNNYASNNVGQWDVMASGSYNDDQNCPPTFSAFERYSLGWTEPTELDPTTDTLINVNPYIPTSQSYRVSVPGRSNEYFLIENRQKTSWDSFLPGHGILVWHIDENQSVWDSNTPNADASHQRVDIVEAGRYYTNTGSSSDAFPGTRNITSYNFQAWSSRNIFGFAWLRENADSTVQFLLTNTDYRLQSPSLTVSDIMGKSARLTWGASELATAYSVSIAKDGAAFDSTSATAAGNYEFTNLEPETKYTAQVVATLASLRSDTVSVPFTTEALQIEEQAPVVLPASGITKTGFTANWNAIPNADTYYVTLFNRHHDGVATYGTGFDNYTTREPNMPKGWYMTDYRSPYSRYHGDATPSVRLAADSSMLVASIPGQKIESVRFWHRMSKAGIRLNVDKFADNQWTNIWTFTDDRARDIVDTLSIGGADSVRFVLTRDSDVSGGYEFLDDIYLTYLFDQYDSLNQVKVSPQTAAKAYAADGSNDVVSYTFRDLDPTLQYAYNIQALEGDRLSLVSDTVNVVPESVVDGINRIVNDSAQQNKNINVYDLQGRRVATVAADGRLDANLPKGIYIVNGKKVVVK